MFFLLELDEGEQNARWSVLLSEFERFSLETVSTFVADSELSLSFKSTNRNPTWRWWRSPTNKDVQRLSL